MRGGSELHSFCGDRVTAAGDVPSVPPGNGEQRQSLVFVTTRGSRRHHLTTRRACVFAYMSLCMM